MIKINEIIKHKRNLLLSDETNPNYEREVKAINHLKKVKSNLTDFVLNPNFLAGNMNDEFIGVPYDTNLVKGTEGWKLFLAECNYNGLIVIESTDNYNDPIIRVALPF